MTFGKLFMIPCPIVEKKTDSLSSQLITQLHRLDHFIVERAKTARHFIKDTQHPIPIQELKIFELDKNDPSLRLTEYLKPLLSGTSMGVISEAGCPGVADPGALCVKWAHENNIQVVPLVGPSSILLALMASGMSGQYFVFKGYLSVKKPDLDKELRKLEQAAQRDQCSQIFMETPYRNLNIFDAACKVLSANTKLCIAANINGNNEWIKTKTIKAWKKTNRPEIHKQPTIFIISS